MKYDITYDSEDKVTKIHAVIWEPVGEVKAVVQIAHGMIEHINRYDNFAKYLNKFGILVCGEDHLGHGLSVIDDVDTNAWSIEGEPSTSVVITKPDTVRLTCASIVNRIDDLVNSDAGYIPTSQMGEIEYINK